MNTTPSSSFSLFGSGIAAKKYRIPDSTSPRQGKKLFMEVVSNYDLRTTDPETQGLFAVYLLMKGKFITQLEKLLEESETPVNVKLVICDFLLEEGFSEASQTVEKVLVETCHISREAFNTKEKDASVSKK